MSLSMVEPTFFGEGDNICGVVTNTIGKDRVPLAIERICLRAPHQGDHHSFFTHAYHEEMKAKQVSLT